VDCHERDLNIMAPLNVVSQHSREKRLCLVELAGPFEEHALHPAGACGSHLVLGLETDGALNQLDIDTLARDKFHEGESRERAAELRRIAKLLA
jgi:hypothetical protein